MIVIDVIVIIFLFTVFAVSHTFLASRKIKSRLAENLGDKIAFYRLFYNITSLLFFAAAYFIAPKPDVIVYDLQYPFDIITFALQVLSLVGLVWAAKPIDMKEFVGVSQIERFLKGGYNVDDLDEKQELKIIGAFKFVRHPIYLFSILFLGLRPTMDLFYLIMFICLVVYFYIGSVYEERKLVEMFGQDYIEYQNSVPRLIPIKFKRKSKNVI
jgi:protein-S-isoprenylcysteine O-methyltransferase Ste14